MARDPHVLFSGRRDGSLLIALDVKPQLAYATDMLKFQGLFVINLENKRPAFAGLSWSRTRTGDLLGAIWANGFATGCHPLPCAP
jgi:hypothetical protein